MQQKPTIFLTAGGTGGHLFPAFAVAHVLASQGYSLQLITDLRGARLASDNTSVTLRVMTLLPLRQAGIVARMRKCLGLIVGFFQAFSWFFKDKPRVIIGFGGYPTLPPLLAACILRVPLILHEQNAVLGRVNRLFANYAQVIAVSWGHTLKISQKQKKKVHLVGMPIRPDFTLSRSHCYQPLTKKEKFNLLVLGGSQGAKIFSEVLPGALELLPLALRRQLAVIQQCRPEDLQKVRSLYAQLKIKAQVDIFFNPIAPHFAQAHLVIARSGASTCAELMLKGCPALLIPYPWAMDDHQTENAQLISQQEAGWHLAQENFSKQSLALIIEDLFMHPNVLLYASEAMYSLGKPQAAQDLASLIKDLS